MVDIAKKAGVSKGTLYLYFDSKELIFQEMVKTMITPMVDEAEVVIKQFEGSSSMLLEMIVTRWWTNVWQSKLTAIPKLIFSEAGNFPDMAEFYVDVIVKRVRGLFEQIIQQGIDNKEFIECDSKTAARLLMAPVIHAHIWKHSLKQYDDSLDEQTYIKLHMNLFLSGLKNCTEKEESNAK